ncbi:Uncharacterized protein PPKH_1081 [Pseudomonas putida]|nr:Uncharacterized protein PPKH_1081 [Pseudomonas putida]
MTTPRRQAGFHSAEQRVSVPVEAGLPAMGPARLSLGITALRYRKILRNKL